MCQYVQVVTNLRLPRLNCPMGTEVGTPRPGYFAPRIVLIYSAHISFPFRESRARQKLTGGGCANDKQPALEAGKKKTKRKKLRRLLIAYSWFLWFIHFNEKFTVESNIKNHIYSFTSHSHLGLLFMLSRTRILFPRLIRTAITTPYLRPLPNFQLLPIGPIPRYFTMSAPAEATHKDPITGEMISKS